MESDTPELTSPSPSLDSQKNWHFVAKAKTVRHAARLGSFIKDKIGPTRNPSRTIWLDSTLSQQAGQNKIKVQVWEPTNKSSTPRAAVINLHGGGWILGRGTDDAPWVDALVELLDVIVFTVDYRLAPKHPFPSPLEDCVDAICQITNRAAEFGIDPSRMILSGFSAGGSNCLGAWVILQNPCRWGYTLKLPPPQIIGLVLFYPLLDWTISRTEKRCTSERPDLTLSKRITHLIDASYVYPSMPEEDLRDPRLSPGLMSDEMLQQLPPVHFCLCEHDMLLAEGLRLTKRLESQNRPFTLRIAKGAKHGWDKALCVSPDESVLVEYREAMRAMEAWFNRSNHSSEECME